MTGGGAERVPGARRWVTAWRPSPIYGGLKNPGFRCAASRLRLLLYFPAMSAIRHNPLLKAFAERLRQNGKPPKLILAAAMRKLLHIAFGVLRSNAPFNPNILTKNI